MPTAEYAVAGRSMTVGGVLSRAFGAIGGAPLVYFGVSFALAALPSVLVRLAVPASAFVPASITGGLFARMLPAVFAVGLAWMLLYLAAQAILFRATAAQLNGRPEHFGSYVGAAARALLPLVGLGILLTLSVGMGWVLLMVPGLMLAMMWSVAAPALVVERIGIFESFGRSRYLTSGARWRIFGIFVLVYAIYLIASAVLGLGFGTLSGLTTGGAIRMQSSLTSSILSVVLQTIFVAISTAIQGTLYIELRDWKDGPMGDRLADIFA